MNPRRNGASSGELLAHRRQCFEQTTPFKVRLKADTTYVSGGPQSRAGARDAVIEPQHPNPSARKDMMLGGVIRWIRRGEVLAGLKGPPHIVEARDICKVRVDALRRRQPA